MIVKIPNCDYCKQGLERHCFNRQTLGIWKKDGCMAEYVTMPIKNLLEVPQNVTNEEAVMAFLQDKIKLLDIIKIVEKFLNEHKPIDNATIDDLLKLDEQIRMQTRQLIENM